MEMRALYNETNGAKGAFVVSTNSSFGIDYGNPDNYPIWCSMYDELGKVGILSCGAGPNRNVNVDNVGDVPSTCSSNYLIGVTNTTQADIKNPSAGYGINNIDIGAPGTNIYSTTPNNAYQYMTGTSMVTPQVAGVIALMYASMPKEMIQSCKEDPENFALLVKKSLLDGADNLSALNGLVASGRRLNAYGAIKTLLENSQPSSIGEVLSQNIALYPNPTTGELKIKSGDLNVNRAELLDIHGKTLGLFDFSAKDTGANTSKPNAPALERVINLSHLPAGVYFLRIKTHVGEVVKKVLKE